MDYQCKPCTYIYSEDYGDPTSGIAPNTKWEDLPEDWCCPMCGATKAAFEKRVDN